MTRLYAAGIAVALAIALGGSAYLLGRHHGAAAVTIRAERFAAAAFVAEYRRAAKATAEVLRIGRRLAADLRDSTDREPATVTIVRREVANAPDFAAMRRSAELQRLRRAQLEAIGSAATDQL